MCRTALTRALLGEDAAEERHVGPQLLGQGVQAGEGSEVDHAVGGLGAVLHRDVSGCTDRGVSLAFCYQYDFNHVTIV